MIVSPKHFWEARVLDWEQGRYADPNHSGVLEWIANRSSVSLRFRMTITPELLRPYLLNKHVVDLGCGSGRIAGKLIEFGAASYRGVDIAEPAIRLARKRYGEHDPRTRFEVISVTDMQPIGADLVISLGLFDWLSDDEIASIFQNSGRADFFHAIAERRRGFQQSLHRAYVQLAYGHRTGAYRPRYMTCDHIKRLATAAVDRPIYAYRSRRLSFGALISTFPIGEEI